MCRDLLDRGPVLVRRRGALGFPVHPERSVGVVRFVRGPGPLPGGARMGGVGCDESALWFLLSISIHGFLIVLLPKRETRPVGSVRKGLLSTLRQVPL